MCIPTGVPAWVRTRILGSRVGANADPAVVGHLGGQGQPALRVPVTAYVSDGRGHALTLVPHLGGHADKVKVVTRKSRLVVSTLLVMIPFFLKSAF